MNAAKVIKTSFKDHFSSISKNYHIHRPDYPDNLFSYLNSQVSQHDVAWDCATGNGQCALKLSTFFSKIIASDASTQQIKQSSHADNINYIVATAEYVPIRANCADLITVAQALHWFDIEAFTKEAARILNSEGVLAVWSYNLLNINPDVDTVINQLDKNILKNYWPPERALVENQYATIHMPFTELTTKPFQMEVEWSLGQLIGYLNTWSSVEAYKKQNRSNPLDLIKHPLLEAWGMENTIQSIRWPITMKLWRK